MKPWESDVIHRASYTLLKLWSMSEMLSDFPVRGAERKAYKLGHPQLHTCNTVKTELTSFGQESVMALFSFPT